MFDQTPFSQSNPNRTPNSNNQSFSSNSTSTMLSGKLNQTVQFFQTRPMLLLLVVVVLGLALVAPRFWGSYNGVPRTVTVVGIGKKTVKAAKASVSFSYIYSGINLQDAVDIGEQQFDGILSGLNQYQPSDVTRSTYQIAQNSRSSVQNGQLQQLPGYQYVNAAQVTINDPSRINEVVKYLYENGAASVTQVVYIPEDEVALDGELRTLAVQDAKNRVKDMVKASGAHLGRVLSIQEGGTNSQTGTSLSSTGMLPNSIQNDANSVQNGQESAVASTGLNSVGDIELQAVASVTYEIW